jgi:hypothetical protein
MDLGVLGLLGDAKRTKDVLAADIAADMTTDSQRTVEKLGLNSKAENAIGFNALTSKYCSTKGVRKRVSRRNTHVEIVKGRKSRKKGAGENSIHQGSTWTNQWEVPQVYKTARGVFP